VRQRDEILGFVSTSMEGSFAKPRGWSKAARWRGQWRVQIKLSDPIVQNVELLIAHAGQSKNRLLC